jgi:hypothetical protein
MQAGVDMAADGMQYCSLCVVGLFAQGSRISCTLRIDSCWYVQLK